MFLILSALFQNAKFALEKLLLYYRFLFLAVIRGGAPESFIEKFIKMSPAVETGLINDFTYG